ncbi:sulfotransferase [Desulfofarcimen acetoxidans DSM 771]|uniref:Sulfotransferase n=1 Tax=Desulfofarcimen acetoxidans (strain ATCC 49208 / DSM 771 / KCTC 5769 / VKM B-1644 / 5575) TaxID=485916 RepID=C8VYP7_DESAS|nr:sulfotransferase [Desulfofarcimen acetoxidans]ACV64768.1 sulfotransferase [Desulfofarcimen acetoxidans DSM 771]
MDRKNVIYIAGYGRSGSTLLEMIIGSNNKIYPLGELTNFDTIKHKDKAKCSCGKYLKECEFWRNIIKEYDLNNKIAINGQKKLWALIFKNTPENIHYVIDSSKTARKNHFRPIRLAKLLGKNIYMIHIVRDGRGCIQSLIRGSNQKMENGEEPKIYFPVLRGTLGWMISNFSAHIFQILHKDKYLRIRYEDFTGDFENVMKKIGVFLDICFQEEIKRIKEANELPTIHQISGNRLRSQRTISLRTDDGWKNSFSSMNNIIFLIFNYFFVKLYEYDIKFNKIP